MQGRRGEERSGAGVRLAAGSPEPTQLALCSVAAQGKETTLCGGAPSHLQVTEKHHQDLTSFGLFSGWQQ